MILVGNNIFHKNTFIQQRTKDDIVVIDAINKDKSDLINKCADIFYEALSKFYILNYTGLKDYFLKFGKKIPLGKKEFSEYISNSVFFFNKKLIIGLLDEMIRLGYLPKEYETRPDIYTCIYSSLTGVDDKEDIQDRVKKEKNKIKKILETEIRKQEINNNKKERKKNNWTMVLIFSIIVAIFIIIINRN